MNELDQTEDIYEEAVSPFMLSSIMFFVSGTVLVAGIAINIMIQRKFKKILKLYELDHPDVIPLSSLTRKTFNTKPYEDNIPDEEIKKWERLYRAFASKYCTVYFDGDKPITGYAYKEEGNQYFSKWQVTLIKYKGIGEKHWEYYFSAMLVENGYTTPDTSQWMKKYMDSRKQTTAMKESSEVEENGSVANMLPITPVTPSDIISSEKRFSSPEEEIDAEFNSMMGFMTDTPKNDDTLDSPELSVESDIFEESSKLDDDIKPIITKLNEKGYKTKYSCSGHPSSRVKKDTYRDGVLNGKLYSTARIVFSKNYTLPSPPKYWEIKVLNGEKNVSLYVTPPQFKIVDGLPTEAFNKWKKKYMSSLTSWVDSLGPLGSKKAKKETTSAKTEKQIMESVIEDLLIDSL